MCHKFNFEVFKIELIMLMSSSRCSFSFSCSASLMKFVSFSNLIQNLDSCASL